MLTFNTLITQIINKIGNLAPPTLNMSSSEQSESGDELLEVSEDEQLAVSSGEEEEEEEKEEEEAEAEADAEGQVGEDVADLTSKVSEPPRPSSSVGTLSGLRLRRSR